MDNEKFQKLNNLLNALKKDVVTPKDIELFLNVVLKDINQAKSDLNTLTKEKVDEFETAIEGLFSKLDQFNEELENQISDKEEYIRNEFIANTNEISKKLKTELVKDVKTEANELSNTLKEKLKEAQDLILELKSIEIKDGKDADEEVIVGKVLNKIELPKPYELIGENVIDIINDLPLDDDLKIDASHIKNLPKPVVGGVVARNIYQMGDVALSSLANNDVLKWNSTNNRWENGAGGGGGGVSGSGTLNKIPLWTPNGTTLGDSDFTSSALTMTLGTKDLQVNSGVVQLGSTGVQLQNSSGNLALTGYLLVTSGGTGFTSYTAGDILYADSTTTLAKLTKGGNNTFLGVNGSGVLGYYAGNAGTVTSVGITAGNLIDVSGSPITTSGNITIDVDLSELTTSTTDADGDYFAVVDAANAQYKLTKANIALSGFNNDAGWTSNTGTVTSVSVASANGFAGTVATATTTPAITISTTVTGLLKGNGTAISAAVSGTDYAPATSGTSILKGNGSGGFSNAVAGTDYQAVLSGSGIVKSTAGTISYISGTSGQFVKGDGSLDSSTYLTSVGTGVANEITYWSGTNTLGSLSTATYPSLTELSYVKGVTSAIQTQLNGKEPTLTKGNLSGTANQISVSGGTGAVIGAGATLSIPSNAQLSVAKLTNLTTDGFIKTSGGDGTLSIDTNTYLTANQTISLSGDVSGSGSTSITTTIGANKVTNAMLAQVATATFKGRTTAGTGNVEDLTVTQATALLNNFVGDSGSGGTKGLVPAPAAGDAAANKFLNADGSWQTVTASAALIVGSSTITSGTTTNILYNNAGVLGEYTLTGGGTEVVMSSSPTITGPTIATVLLPQTSAVTIGNSGSRWGNLYLDNGTKIDFNNGDVTLTHASNKVTLAGGTLELPAVTTTVAPLKFLTGGTLLTTPEDGAIEMDDNCFYGTVDAGNRGVIPVEHIIRANATRTFTSNTSQQAIFNSPTNGTLTLETGTYLFEGLVAMDTMSGTSGNGKFSIIGAGTATLNDILWQAYGNDLAASATGAATGGSWHVIATQTATNIVTAVNTTALCFMVKGTFTVTVAGTIIPSFAQTTAAAAVVNIGSYFKCNRIGDTSMVSVGQWT